MISFATLILTLVTGTVQVEVMVDRPVAIVEIHLDGAVVGHLTEEPWRLDVDLGSILQPHELVAVAKDERGRELSRARQMINLPRSRAEVALSLEEGSDGRYRIAHAMWESVGDLEVHERRAFFDGALLSVAPSGRIELPPYDLETLHYLVVQIRFAGGIQAEAAVAFGGRFGEASQTELTSIAVELRDADRELPEASLDGWFRSRGAPLRVTAVDRPPAHIFLVRDRSSQAHFVRVARKLKHRREWMQRRPRIGPRGARDGLRRGDALHLVDTVPGLADREDGLATRLFPVSSDLARYRRGQGITWVLSGQRFDERNVGRLRPLEAVATAALRAVALGSPRAVVLVAGPTARDHGPHPANTVLEYLEVLQVPFRLWSVGGAEKAPPVADWGDAIDVSDPADLMAAVRELRALLDRQRLVWVEGIHLPQRIELSEVAQQYVRLAGHNPLSLESHEEVARAERAGRSQPPASRPATTALRAASQGE